MQLNNAMPENVMLQQRRFVEVEGEHTLIIGELGYVKSTFNIHRCDCIVTNKRFLVWSRRNGLVKSVLFGVFAEVGMAYLTRDITFQLPWSHLDSITKGKYGLADTLTLKNKGGEQYRLLFNSDAKKGKLFAAIMEASGTEF